MSNNSTTDNIYDFPFLNPDLPQDARITDLIARLTLAEKAGLLSQESPAITRLGIPYFNWWSEALHGVARGGRATVFPQAIGLGATFDPALMHQIAAAIGDEARAKHHAAVRRGNRACYLGLTIMSPTINILRDPRWGRSQESYGEDPVLTAAMGTAFVQGLQGDDPRYLKTAAYAKHFAVHSGPEAGRYAFNATVSAKDLHETYLYAFQHLVAAGVVGIMSAYNAVNGEPCSAGHTLLTTILKGQWGFTGNVISDGGGLVWLRLGHHAVETAAEASARGLNNGLDVDFDDTYLHGLTDAVAQGLLSEATVDAALRRALRTRFKLGHFDPEERVPYAAIPESVVGCAAHTQLAYQAAVESTVLLKNAGAALPIPGDVPSIFVCGPNATNIESLLGSYYGQNSQMTTLLEGLTANIAVSTVLTYARLCPIAGGQVTKKDNWLDGGQPYEYVVAAMGLSPLYEGEAGGDPEDSPHDGDREALGLPGHQLEILQAVRACGKKLVVVLFGGSAIEIDWAMQHADAVVFAFYPGQCGGSAIADVLFGHAVPSGRMPFSTVHTAQELPPFTDYSMANRTYRYMHAEPAIPFGFGLSYTTFRYDAITLDRQEVQAGQPLTVRVEVRNTGALAGEEVLQLYLTHHGAPVAVPRFALKAFRRVHLQAGASTSMEFVLPPEAMALYLDDGTTTILPTEVTVTVGGCAPFQCAEVLGMGSPVRAGFKILV